ncbi:MAG: hypothetical protein RSE46_06880 [Janthinobacterium sp.]
MREQLQKNALIVYLIHRFAHENIAGGRCQGAAGLRAGGMQLRAVKLSQRRGDAFTREIEGIHAATAGHAMGFQAADQRPQFPQQAIDVDGLVIAAVKVDEFDPGVVADADIVLAVSFGHFFRFSRSVASHDKKTARRRLLQCGASKVLK